MSYKLDAIRQPCGKHWHIETHPVGRVIVMDNVIVARQVWQEKGYGAPPLEVAQFADVQGRQEIQEAIAAIRDWQEETQKKLETRAAERERRKREYWDWWAGVQQKRLGRAKKAWKERSAANET